VQPDVVQAHMWFSLAAAQGDELAHAFQGELAKHMTAAEMAQSRQLVENWSLKRD